MNKKEFKICILRYHSLLSLYRWVITIIMDFSQIHYEVRKMRTGVKRRNNINSFPKMN